MEGENRVAAWLSHAARSRLVNKRYFTPSPAADWRAGRIQRENTEREESYIQAVIRICEEETIDTIFPSFDPHVYVFSKNKDKFERLGVLIPVPDYEQILTPLDKYRTIQAAQEVGLPCPKTYLAERMEDLKWIAKELGFPLVIKPRFTAGGRGTEIAINLSELLAKTRTAAKPGFHIIQEYIPGNDEDSIVLFLDFNCSLKMAYADKRIRTLEGRDFATVSESLGYHPCTTQAVKLCQKIGWRGSMTVQMKIDSRDGVAKLMEINPRMGYGLWRRVAIGVNEPLISLKVFKGEEVKDVPDYPAGTLFLCPVEDLLALGLKLIDLLVYKLRVNFRWRKFENPLNSPARIKELMRTYKETYFSRKKKLYNLYFAYVFNDPFASSIWWLQTLSVVWRAAKKLGK